MKCIEFQGKFPNIDKNAWVGHGACIVGDVRIAEGTGIWYNCVLRADISYIEIGKDTNIQDGSICHVDTEKPLIIGNRVTVGHGAILHACTIEDDVLIGMGAIILSGAIIKTGAVIGAGAVVAENTVVESNILSAGVPAKPKKEIDLKEKIIVSSENYVKLARLQFKDGE
jgi:carbonic anhydrase/acetyltransferase-like protein (isoleucine patch superfamily)